MAQLRVGVLEHGSRSWSRARRSAPTDLLDTGIGVTGARLSNHESLSESVSSLLCDADRVLVGVEIDVGGKWFHGPACSAAPRRALVEQSRWCNPWAQECPVHPSCLAQPRRPTCFHSLVRRSSPSTFSRPRLRPRPSPGSSTREGVAWPHWMNRAGSGPGTWVTSVPGDMGNTRGPLSGDIGDTWDWIVCSGGGACLDAVAPDRPRERETEVRGSLAARRPHDDGALCRLRDQPEDRLQDPEALRAGRP